ncbi:helix-turn-helix domain-containing protein [Nocardia brasiliensis]|uniref:AraC family transcriptional regulator n=1 Tax=Nocardia brasiliensis (strain ATCC 700358 / HUJEG-1) TaxID=1133849 RepID=K0ETX1_NOCB7|nr:AraC family transcriptional regulator [Nocardia brasiliensis]AFU00932.1 AraC family transcriptional regulator [Nocardia brasiliensis ATCC 700358]OCF84159.1 AraC family transcriptional regulator [Nocardia brasiliensis]
MRRWQGTALLRPGTLAFAGAIGTTAAHAHHAVQLMTAPTELCVVDGNGKRHSGTHLIIPADAVHRIDTGAAIGTAVFLDPDSEPGRVAHQRARTDGWNTGFGFPAHTVGERGLDTFVTALTSALLPAEHRPDRHPAVEAAMALLPDLVAAGTVSTRDLAGRVGLSATRLTHLFTAQVGIPLRRFILWLRLGRAIATAAAGADLTTAAHAAGFADSAHLTRTCREIFGLPPSALSRNLRWDIAHTP